LGVCQNGMMPGPVCRSVVQFFFLPYVLIPSPTGAAENWTGRIFVYGFALPANKLVALRFFFSVYVRVNVG
jgi:hypothetical protein